MKNTKTGTKGNQESTTKDSMKEREVDVLYQRLGDRWFAFSLIDNEVFVGSIPTNNLNAVDAADTTGTKKKTKGKKIAGNS